MCITSFQMGKNIVLANSCVGPVTETNVISQGTYFSDIYQAEEFKNWKG